MKKHADKSFTFTQVETKASILLVIPYVYYTICYLFAERSQCKQHKKWNCSKLKITTPGRIYERRSGVCIVNFEQISHIVLVFTLLSLKK